MTPLLAPLLLQGLRRCDPGRDGFQDRFAAWFWQTFHTRDSARAAAPMPPAGPPLLAMLLDSIRGCEPSRDGFDERFTAWVWQNFYAWAPVRVWSREQADRDDLRQRAVEVTLSPSTRRTDRPAAITTQMRNRS